MHDAVQANPATPALRSRRPLLVVVEDEPHLSEAFRSICECLNVAVDRVPLLDDLNVVLHARRPMAVATDLDTQNQDSRHVLMTIAAYDRRLPVLLIANGNPNLLDAMDALEKKWDLSAVTKWSSQPAVGGLIEFLFRAGRMGNCMRVMPV
jgi:hypothetical protein